MQLGKTIVELRTKRRMKQSVLADAAGISQTYLSQIENNEKESTIRILGRIAKSLEIPLPILMFIATNRKDMPAGKEEKWTIVVSMIKGLLDEELV